MNDMKTTTTDADANTTVSEKESHYFDSIVKDQGEFNPFLDHGWATIRRRFEESVPKSFGQRLLDVGCGTGQSRQIYVPRIEPENYTGIDLSGEAVSIAAGKFPDSTWNVGDACALPFPDASFEVVCFSSVLHHIPNFVRAVQEAHRVLKPDGYVFAFDPNLRHPAMRLFRDPRSRFYRSEGVSPNECPLLSEELHSAFIQSNLTVVNQFAQSDLPYREVGPRSMNSVLSVYNALDKIWEKSGAGRKYGTFVITVGQKPETAVQQ